MACAVDIGWPRFVTKLFCVYLDRDHLHTNNHRRRLPELEQPCSTRIGWAFERATLVPPKLFHHLCTHIARLQRSNYLCHIFIRSVIWTIGFSSNNRIKPFICLITSLAFVKQISWTTHQSEKKRSHMTFRTKISMIRKPKKWRNIRGEPKDFGPRYKIKSIYFYSDWIKMSRLLTLLLACTPKT